MKKNLDEEDKSNQELLEYKSERIEHLQNELSKFEELQAKDNINCEKLNKLYQLGMIDSDGNPTSNYTE